MARRLIDALRNAALIAAIATACVFGAEPARSEIAPPAEGAVRIASINLHLARGKEGKLIAELRAGSSPQIEALVEILQRVRPDIVVLQELDWDRAGVALALFEAELARGRAGLSGLSYAHRIQVPVNTGDPSGLDLDNDGKTYGPNDAFGWGVFPGQFGFVVLSKHPIDADAARTFRLTRWADTPLAELRPKKKNGDWFHTDEAWAAMRLSSKTHLDAPITLPNGAVLHILVSHPTPPVFDGPEDRNGARNAAEILFWPAYISNAAWIRDDQGRSGGLPEGALFVVAGDLNADPSDGDGRREPIGALLADPRIQDPQPRSEGGAAAAQAQAGANARHKGDPSLDTADWRDDDDLEKGRLRPGNLRVDYILPSAALRVLGSGVFWPAPADPLHRLVGAGKPIVSSDHRLVWVDISAQ